ncbi:MAG: hypothetical protein R3C19_11270 [Planctomycetaceae bacterium]
MCGHSSQPPTVPAQSSTTPDLRSAGLSLLAVALPLPRENPAVRITFALESCNAAGSRAATILYCVWRT